MNSKRYDGIFLFISFLGLAIAFANSGVKYCLPIGIGVFLVFFALFSREYLLFMLHLLIGQVSFYLNKYDVAKKYFTKVIEFEPRMGNTINWYLANICEFQGDYEEAFKNYNIALSFKPDDVLRIYNVGNTLLNLGNYDEALPYFKRILELDDNCSYGYLGLGCLYLRKEQDQEALEYFNKAIDIKYDNYWCYFNRAYTYKYLGDKEKALEDYRQALKYRPKYVDLKPLYEEV